MKDAQPAAIKLEEYKVPVFLVDETHLSFDIQAQCTEVSSKLSLRRNPEDEGEANSFYLDGQNLELLDIAVDGRSLSDNEYQVDDEGLKLFDLPNSCEVSVRTRIFPEKNTALEGLYKSGMYCTQCEAEGFRKITYYPDRPDVLSKFTTTIIADDESYPTLLSNGNRISEQRQEDGRLAVSWHDPFPKPSYLFALVAGNLSVLEDRFVTCSGREIDLKIYSEAHNIDQCCFAMDALKRAMRWDEEVYGREYDLDIFMVVAVDDFNMGAMENKGLNIFNSSCVLASADTASDAAYERVEAIVAHEYFHNWSGNRVTLRDWFQLSLKEGFTVFRDAEFTSDMNSRTVKRIEDVNFLRTIQFAEDAGPLSHSVRPESYIEISNFYTTTIYEKGAEVVRMIHTLVGSKNFRAGSDLYFERHDGGAVTTDDFVVAMEDASGIDLTQFRLWYSQAGTPRIKVSRTDRGDSLQLTIQQSCPATPGQDSKQAFHIPLSVGFLGADGQDLLGGDTTLISLSSEAKIDQPSGSSSCLVHLKEEVMQLEVKIGTPGDLNSKQIAISMLRGFSAPVIVEFERTQEELFFLAANDSDGFSRWDAITQIFCQYLDQLRVRAPSTPSSKLLSQIIDERFLQLILGLIAESMAAEDDGESKAMLAGMLAVPGEAYLHEQMTIIDVDGIAEARKALRTYLGQKLFEQWHQLYIANKSNTEYSPGGAQSARRSIKSVALGFMLLADAPEHISILKTLINELICKSDNLTDRLLGLRSCLSSAAISQADRKRYLDDFYDTWKSEKLVVIQWFMLQASCSEGAALARVEALETHEAFDSKNPNSVRALYGGFCAQNHQHFHNLDGSGYNYLTQRIKRLDALNPQLAARLLTPLTRWKRHTPERQRAMQKVLSELQNSENLSKDVFEVITKSLAD